MKHFLIVEDDSTMRRAFSLLLKGKGRCITEAANGQEAEKILKNRTFDLVITDLFLDDYISGLDIFKANSKRMPVLIVTGFAESALGEEARRIAGQHYLEKPFSLDAFTTLVADLINEKNKK